MRTIVALVVLLCAAPASAEVTWVGDFETADFDQYSFLLNPTINDVDYTTLVQDIVLQGDWAARIELHDDARWPNDLRRVELQHAPPARRTAEGATTFFAWSVYLPEDIAEDPATQIGYWESNNSYQQMMAFTLRGRDLSFVTRRPNNVVHWDGQGVMTPGEWHRIAMRVLWSTDEGTGTVSVWFDGVEVVSDAAAQTLADDNAHFVQFGMLRGNVDFADVPVIYIDDAIEADTLAEVRPDLNAPPMEPDPSDMGVRPLDMGADTGAFAPDLAEEPDTGGASPDLGISGSNDMGAGSTPSSNDDGGGCGCAQTSPASGLGAWVLLAAVSFRRRHRRRRES